ncbi:cache domain-containing sensor histidine kinase [Cohnella thailandensis]|uniref:Histidine kinase n=1 Tax=Cohnella thailandensis TaxID=557557 RepID=A0A841SZL0_9BACL|nr:sensor histidine kinase [Cohnella thailandensis]MBB6636066.1 histidine kinase [Cohnella thailandensis]MBP1976779.1 sensor histidine kinase YesM [Cohnella thailandensis]
MRRLGIRSRLFFSITLVVSFVIAALSVFFYDKLSSILWERSLESSRQMLQRVDASLTQALRDLDRISAQVIYNPDFQNRFQEAFVEPESFEALDRKKSFETTLSTLNGPSFIAEQINVFNLEGDMISYGLKIDPYPDLKDRILETDWVRPTEAKGGDKILNPPHRDTWFKSGELVFSLSRLFPYASSDSPQFVEVQQRYDKLEEIVGDALSQTHNELYIFDDQGRLFYPAAEKAGSLPFDWADIPNLSPGVFHSMTEKKNGQSYVLGWLRSAPFGMTIVAAQPRHVLLSPVKDLRNVVLTVTIAAGLFALLVAYAVASTIASPLRLILRDMKRWDLEQFHLKNNRSRAYSKASFEIRELHDGFVSMKQRLHHSIEQRIEAERRESLANLQALRRQLQPHFVYNTLSSIGILAENEGAPMAADMTFRMMRMMEYISRQEDDTTRLAEELSFTENYLELMKLRYQENFRYEVKTDDSLLGVSFPKFVLQPLVENSFAHGFKEVYPPWVVRIDCVPLSYGVWTLRIADNGSGFSPEALDRVRSFAEELKAGRPDGLERLAARGFGGLGIENAMTRLHLFYGGDVAFSVRNLEEGMELLITIGKEG